MCLLFRGRSGNILSSTAHSWAVNTAEAGDPPAACAIDHGHPEHAPAQDAEHGDEPHEALRRAQPRRLGPASGLEYFMEHLDLPAQSIPAEHSEGVLQAVDIKVGHQLPFDPVSVWRVLQFSCVDNRGRQRRIFALCPFQR